MNVYALIIYEEKHHIWDSLIHLKEENLHQNSIVVGDFNMVLYSSKKKGGNILTNPFRERMEDLI